MPQFIRIDRSDQRPFENYYEAVHKLRSMLPPPLDNTPEGLERRDRTAIARIAALVPASSDEVELGVHYVVACEQAADCMRQINAHAGDPGRLQQLFAQSACLGREARGFRATLLRVQTMRMNREKTRDAAYKADTTELYVLTLMTAALTQKPVPPEF